MEAELRDHLITAAKAYAEARSLKLVTVARLAIGDWRFFDRLTADNASFTARKYDAAMQWFSANWPEGVDWPEGAPRPEPVRQGAAA